jgi:geranylgeranyl pyrophosphate synthase
MKLDAFLTETRSQLESALANSFSNANSDHLRAAIHYSLLDGGKRFRPALVRAAAMINGVEGNVWLVAAQAVEMIHVYSLIHDDLPAMDNDDLRRGKATNHKAFDEATAILAGDALQTEAFSLIAQSNQLNDTQARQMTQTLATASGATGMVGGQMIDLLSEQKSLNVEELANLHRLKTGALIKAALRLGLLCSPKVTQRQLVAIENYGDALGLAFQIMDDVLDVTSSTAVLGKPQGSDLAAQKSTYVKLLGLQGAKDKATEQHALATQCLKTLNQDEQSVLWQLADYVLLRDH